jgi:predicted nuclease of predicted toxin-antitoxin system
MVKLKLDENFSPYLAKLFIDAGFDTETVLSENLSGAADDFLFEKIKKENRCIVTLDLDFANILRYPADEMAGIIVIRPIAQFVFLI